MLRSQLDKVVEYLEGSGKFADVYVVEEHADNEYGGMSIMAISHRIPQIGNRQYTNHYKFDSRGRVQSLVTSADFNGHVSRFETKATLGLFSSIEDILTPQGERTILS